MKTIETDAQIRVLLPARMIPTGSSVSKVSGTTVYMLSRGLKLYTHGTGLPPKEIVPAPNSIFLIDRRTDAAINQYDENLVLAWHTTPHDLWMETQEKEVRDEGEPIPKREGTES